MFDFPQPGETYRCSGFPDVVVSGVLADGIPWDLPYRCPGLVWKPVPAHLHHPYSYYCRWQHGRNSAPSFFAGLHL